MNQYDHLKNKFRDYKVDIDKDKLWKNTSHAIPKRKRRAVPLIVLLAGLILSGWLLYSGAFLPMKASKQTIGSVQQINPDPTATHSSSSIAENLDAVPDQPCRPGAMDFV